MNLNEIYFNSFCSKCQIRYTKGMYSISTSTAPEFLKLLAHDVRWQLLQALAHGDLRVLELAAVVTRPINHVSYHLKLLRDRELVHERRSSADGRDVYYTLDLARLGDLYRRNGIELHPGLLAGQGPQGQAIAHQPLRVLFVCTHNRARSQMAEGILRYASHGQMDVHSAGIRPGEIHPLAVQVLRDAGIDISTQQSKHLDEVCAYSFDRVITVCDQAREQCPSFPGNPPSVHWSIADPIAAAERMADEETRRKFFAQTAQELATRIHFFLLAESHHSAASA